MSKREYTKDGLTVLWDSDLCEHCEACWRGLPAVFNPQARPWVNMDGASVNQIEAQVLKCPSKALDVKKEKPD